MSALYFYVATLVQRFIRSVHHLVWYDIPGLVFPIMVSLVECVFFKLYHVLFSNAHSFDRLGLCTIVFNLILIFILSEMCYLLIKKSNVAHYLVRIMYVCLNQTFNKNRLTLVTCIYM